MKSALALAIIFSAVVACSPPGDPAETRSPVNEQQIIDRFTDDIWPAVEGYRAPAQGSPQNKRWSSIIDPELRSATLTVAELNTYTALRSAGQSLGQNRYDSSTRTTHYPDGGLSLANVEVQAVHDNAAELDICYTYTHAWYVNIADVQRSPAASEATIGLVNVDSTWYLRSITDDHVVPGCGPIGKSMNFPRVSWCPTVHSFGENEPLARTKSTSPARGVRRSHLSGR